MGHEAVIGLEVHAQLRTETKLFCGCPARFGDQPNTNVCPVCAGLPGALPVLNRAAIAHAVRVGLALRSDVRATSTFVRKSYFYPDLPKGYQITQHEHPLAHGGAIELRAATGEARHVRIARVHVEEDAGKSVHAAGTRTSLVDLNRAGVPLVEVVTAPDLRSPSEAAELLRALRLVLRYLGACEGSMERGSLRCDANVSIRSSRSAPLGERTEIKNLNSFRNLEDALEAEIERQSRLVAGGGRVERETRAWDEQTRTTLPTRDKEQLEDYRYFPEPDLPPLVLPAEWVAGLGRDLPELPDARQRRLTRSFAIAERDAAILVSHRGLADYFEQVASQTASPTRACAFVLTEVLGRSDLEGLDARFPLAPRRLAELLDLVENGTIPLGTAKRVFALMCETDEGAAAIVERLDLAAIRDAGALEQACRAVVEAYPTEVHKYRSGKTAVIDFLVGQVLRRSANKLVPSEAKHVLKEILDE